MTSHTFRAWLIGMLLLSIAANEDWSGWVLAGAGMWFFIALCETFFEKKLYGNINEGGR